MWRYFCWTQEQYLVMEAARGGGMDQSNWSSYHYYSSSVEVVRASQTPLDLVIGIASYHVLLGDHCASLIAVGCYKKIVHFLCMNIVYDQRTIGLISNWSKNTETRFRNNLFKYSTRFLLGRSSKMFHIYIKESLASFLSVDWNGYTWSIAGSKWIEPTN